MNDNYTPYMNRTDIAGLSAVRRFSLMTVILSIEACAMSHAINPASDLEDSVCGIVNEPMTFWQFRWTAGAPDESRVRSIRNISRLSFTTRDGRKLGGYKLSAANPQGYLLVAQGNAMLADQIMCTMTFFLDFGLDVYVYDYRGYGLSEGKSRLKAIVSDYWEIIASLNALGYGRRYLYACPWVALSWPMPSFQAESMTLWYWTRSQAGFLVWDVPKIMTRYATCRKTVLGSCSSPACEIG